VGPHIERFSTLSKQPPPIEISLNIRSECVLEDNSSELTRRYSAMKKSFNLKDRSLNTMKADPIEKDDDIFGSPRKIGRVLIVDDVPMNRKMLRRLLINRFDQCEEAENGQQAVDMVREAMATGMSYDVITMDYQMPVMDGVTATCSMRDLGCAGYIVGVTGNALAEDVDSFLEKGANIVLTKPLSIKKFDEYMTSIVDGENAS